MNNYQVYPVYTSSPCEPTIEVVGAANLEEAIKIARAEFPTASILRRLNKYGQIVGKPKSL